jgi:hypothetical protein
MERNYGKRLLQNIEKLNESYSVYDEIDEEGDERKVKALIAKVWEDRDIVEEYETLQNPRRMGDDHYEVLEKLHDQIKKTVAERMDRSEYAFIELDSIIAKYVENVLQNEWENRAEQSMSEPSVPYQHDHRYIKKGQFESKEQLKEDYYTRLQQVIDQVKDTLETFNFNPMLFGTLDEVIVSAANKHSPTEIRLGGAAASSLMKDVKAALSKQGIIKKIGAIKAAQNRAPYYVQSAYSYDDKVPVTHKDLQDLGMHMQTAAGAAFPDGDPNDMLYQFFRARRWDPQDAYQKLVPAAAKKYLHTNSYDDYLADMWDDVYGDWGMDYKSAVRRYNLATDPVEKKKAYAEIEPARRQFKSLGHQNPWR